MGAAELPLSRNLEQFPELHPPLNGQSALAEANRCLFCFDAPCTVACPTHIDVPRFIKKISTGNLRGSALTILDANILGLSCARVCPVDVLCEGSCVLHRYNQKPIQIGRLQRYAMDGFYGGAAPSVAHLSRAGNGPASQQKIACIGGGPASLACAAELARRSVAPNRRVTIVIEPDKPDDWIAKARPFTRPKVIAEGWSDDGIDRIIEEERQAVRPGLR